MPSPVAVSGLGEGVKLAMTLSGAVVLVIIVLVILIVANVLCRPADRCTYRRHGPPWRRRYRAVPARDQDGSGLLTVRELQLWDDLVARYDTDAAADPRWRGRAG